MSLKDTWVDKKNNEDYVVAEDINSIAGAVITIEDKISGGIDNTPLIVRLTGNNDTGFTADKTFVEITAAVEKGKNVLASVTVEGTQHILALSSVTADENAMFAETIVTQFEGHTDYDTSYVFLYSDDTIAVDIGSMSAPTPITVVIEGTEGNYTASKTFKQLHNIISTHDNAAVVAMIETDPACCFSLTSVTATQISFTCARLKDGKINMSTVTISNTDEIIYSSVDDIAISIVSVSESTQDGGNNIITFSDGTTLTVKNGSKGSQGVQGAKGEKGEKGDKGDKGETGATGTAGIDGKTPIRGTDYWTEADKQEIVTETTAIDKNYIDDELAKRAQVTPEFVNSIDECTDTSKLYVLPDGYIYAWMKTEGVSYTNQIPLSIDTNHNIYNGIGYKDGYRYSSSLEEKESSSTFITGYIPVKYGDVLRFTDGTLPSDTTETGGAFVVGGMQMEMVNSSFSRILQTTPLYLNASDNLFGSTGELSDSNYYIKGTVSTEQLKNIAYIKLTFVGSGANAIMTVNEEISAPTIEYRWANTGIFFVGSEYEDRIASLENNDKRQDEELTRLEAEVDNISQGSITVPDYWVSEIDDAISRTDQAQSYAGVNAITFVWTSDIHGSKYLSTRGKILVNNARKVMSELNIPLFVCTGDLMSQSSHKDSTYVYEEESEVQSWLSTIPYYHKGLVMGNHDGAWGTQEEGYYSKQLPIETMYNIIYRNQSMDYRRKSSGNGTYYYIDNELQRVRMIFLNTNNTPKNAIQPDSTAIYDRFHQPCYCQEQLTWLTNEALNLPDNYIACIFGHDPQPRDYTQLIGIVDAYNNRTTFTKNYTDGSYTWCNSAINVDYQQAKGRIVGVFNGHVHKDTIRTANDSVFETCPLLTITTSLGGDVRDTDDRPARTEGTSEELAFDIVVVSREEEKIYMFRVGNGYDREVYYGTKNLIPQSTEFDSTALYNSKGYKTNTYYSTSASTVTDNAGGTSGKTFTTGLITPKAGQKVRLENCWIDPTATAETYGVAADKLNCVWQLANSTGSNTWANMVTSIATDIVYDGDKIVGWTYAALVSSLSMKGIAFTLASNNPMNAVMYIEE